MTEKKKQVLTSLTSALAEGLKDVRLSPLRPGQLCPCGCGQTLEEMKANAPKLPGDVP